MTRMKLDRNLNEAGIGKYALIKLRVAKPEVVNSMVGSDGVIKPATYEIPARAVDFGNTEDTDFFVIRLKDKYAAAALQAYAIAASEDDEEYAKEIEALAEMAWNHPSKKRPD